MKNHHLLLFICLFLLLPISARAATPMVAANENNTMALKADGTVWLWGKNEFGQLGDGTTLESHSPVQVVGLTDVEMVAAGFYHMLALLADGTVKAWGYNGYGQLGDGTTTDSQTPVTVDISDVTAIAAGQEHSVALKSDGTVWSWGRNYFGQLGDGSTETSILPIQVPNLNWVSKIAAGSHHTVALKSNGTLRAWGWNRYGQLGDGTLVNASSPVELSGVEDQVTITAGHYHTLSINSSGEVLAWGSNSTGQLGLGETITFSNTPQTVTGLTGAVGVSAGGGHSAAWMSDGSIKNWGENTKGQLGNDSTADSSIPVAVDLSDVLAVSTGDNHSVALLTDGSVWAWGHNLYGQLGNGSQSNQSLPVQVVTQESEPFIIGLDADGACSGALLVVEDIPASGDLTCEGWDDDGLTFHVDLQGTLGEVVMTAETGAFEYTPVADANGSDSFTFHVSDGILDSDTATITVTIVAVDDPPTISGTPVVETAPGEVYIFTPTASDVDGDELLFAIDNLPGWATFDTATGTLSGTPQEADIGTTDSILISVTAGGESASLAAFDLAVLDLDTPVVNTLTGGAYNTSQTITLACSDDDPGCVVYYTLDGSDPVTSASRQIHDAQSPLILDTEGSTTLNYVAMDGFGLYGEVATATFTIDFTPPQLTITQPEEGEIINVLRWLDGVASDSASGISEVRLLFWDGFYFASGDMGIERWSDSEPDPWPLAEDISDSSEAAWSSWYYNLTTTLQNGSDYQVTVQALDGAGNVATAGPISFTIHNGDAYPTEVSIALSSNAILPDGEVSGTGVLTRVGSSDSDLSDHILSVTVRDPDGLVVESHSVTTYDTYGHFIIPELSGFGEEGYYTIEADFEGNAMLLESAGSATVYVGPSAGYAIIVEGKIENEEGLESHNLTTNRIYDHLLDRGFNSDDIQYFNYDTSQEGVTDLPSEAAIEEAITSWALGKMIDIPAPLYLVMVDHGSVNAFHLDSEELTPTELDGWLDTLEAALTRANPEALEMKRVVIIGACYSGSFIAELSEPGRVVITSAAADEVSYKGALVQPDPDTDPEGTPVRVGEFFLEEFFGALSQGGTLNEAFREATDTTEIYTRGEPSTNSTSSPMDDGARQHPQLDDNGDGISTNNLDDADTDDGAVAAALYLGGEGSHLANSAEVPADIDGVTDTLYLSSSESSGDLWLRANDDAQVAWGWVEIRKPGKELEASDGTQTGQVDPDLPWEFMTLGDDGSWQLSYDGFDEPGRYEIYYYVQDRETLDTSPMQRSVVYKNRSENSPPSSFNLVSPELPPETVLTVGAFEWEMATDPDGDGVTYNLIIATDYYFTNEVYRQEEIVNTSTFVGTSAGLEDVTLYFWKVEAVDAYGAVTTGPRWTLRTDNTNALLGTLTGYIYDEESLEGVVGAAVTAVGEDSSSVTAESSEPYGGFVLSQVPGELSVTVVAEGYEDQTLTVTLPELEALLSNIALAQEGSTDQEATFADVATDRWGWSFIETLAENSITLGCDSENYCPDNELQRSEMAIFLLRGIEGASYIPETGSGTVFDDVVSGYWAGNYIEEFADRGITSGCDASNYCPSRNINRAEMAIFLVRSIYGMDYAPPAATGTVYGDISSSYWAAAYIEQLAEDGILDDTLDTIRACDEGNFCPSLTINRAEMAVFLVKAFGLE
ncbi:MAG: S-layer homology domain-containing protein [Magnetococcales bacterium]|nr:S-layer homology domain-containing protein [Magnetococcales bacterium]